MNATTTQTEISVRAFCSDFTFIVEKGPKTLKQAIRMIEEDFEWETAHVNSIRLGDKLIVNKNKKQA